MDKSYFNGKLCGCRLGETSWEDDEKWAFSLAQHKTLDAIIEQVPSKRARDDLKHVIEKNCKEGTFFLFRWVEIFGAH